MVFSVMRSRRTIGLVAVGIVIVGAIILAVTHDPDPVYEGRHLSEWLEAYGFGPQEGKEEAKRALCAMGPTALRLMVKWIAHEPPIWRGRMCQLADRLPMPWIVFHWVNTDSRRDRALAAWFGFEAFGPVKTNVGPALVGIANDPSRGESAGRAMAILLRHEEFSFPETFVSQVTNGNARQQMQMLGK